MPQRRSVLTLMIALAIITYLDRIAIAVAGPRIQEELNIPPNLWGWVVGAFVLAYGLFEIPTGALGDRIGQRKVITRIVVWWSAFTAFTGLARGFYPLVAIRFLFGAGEAGAYPNMSGVIVRWFPLQERARTQGYIWAASRFGGALSPLLVVPMQAAIGWRMTFFVLGLVGIVWSLVWWRIYRDRAIDGAEASSHTDVPWRALLSQRRLWLIIAMYFFYAWGSWFYFGWFPTYLKALGFSDDEMKIYSALPYLFGTAGNLIGGYLCDRLVGVVGLKSARRLVGGVSLAISAVLLVVMTLVTGDKTAFVIVSSLGFGFADIMLPAAWAVCLDVGHKYAGVVTGTMNTAGQMGGFVCSVLFGYMVDGWGNYHQPLWVVAASVMIGAILFARIDPTRPLVIEDRAAVHA